MLHAEDREDERQERRITRKPNVSGRYFVGPAQSINSVLQPILSDIAVNEGVGHNSGKAENEKQPQKQSSGCNEQKKSQISANQFGHVGNISRLKDLYQAAYTGDDASNR